jgi:hypothetical protein
MKETAKDERDRMKDEKDRIKDERQHGSRTIGKMTENITDERESMTD